MDLDDPQAILDFVARYSYTYDSGEIDDLASLFTGDAEIGFFFGPGASVPAFKATSTEEIRSSISRVRSRLREQKIQPRHFQTNTLLTETSDGLVSGQTMLLVSWQHRNELSPRLVHSGVYEDEFKRTSNGWRFSKRIGRVDHKNKAED